jgi:hypothetical protein
VTTDDMLHYCNDNIHMLQAYVSKCFRYFRHMFQVFYIDVAKVSIDVAYTCMLQEYFSSVSGVSYIHCNCFKCFRCFIHMLQVFQTYVSSVFSSVSDVCGKCFSTVSNVCCKCFIWMLQM